MANIYLDTNRVLDIAFRNPTTRDTLDGHTVFLSPLSIHILCYAEKKAVPDEGISSFVGEFIIVDLTDTILKKALDGPTTDLEDNIQLHSAAEAECDYFLTNDKKILAMTYFGKTKMVSTLAKPSDK